MWHYVTCTICYYRMHYLWRRAQGSYTVQDVTWRHASCSLNLSDRLLYGFIRYDTLWRSSVGKVLYSYSVTSSPHNKTRTLHWNKSIDKSLYLVMDYNHKSWSERWTQICLLIFDIFLKGHKKLVYTEIRQGWNFTLPTFRKTGISGTCWGMSMVSAAAGLTFLVNILSESSSRRKVCVLCYYYINTFNLIFYWIETHLKHF